MDTQNGIGAQLARENAGVFVAPALVRIPNVEFVRETSRLVWCRADGREFYVPREHLFGDEVRAAGDLGTLVVPDWFARDRGLQVERWVSEGGSSWADHPESSARSRISPREVPSPPASLRRGKKPWTSRIIVTLAVSAIAMACGERDTAVRQSTITVANASHGRNCAALATGNATQSMQVACDGKTACDYEIRSATFGSDPCVGTHKDFSYSWSCSGYSDLKSGRIPGEANGYSASLTCP